MRQPPEPALPLLLQLDHRSRREGFPLSAGHPKQAAEQGQRPVDAGGRERAPAARMLDGKQLLLVRADTAGRELGQRGLLPELGLQVPGNTLIFGQRPLPRLGLEVPIKGLGQRHGRSRGRLHRGRTLHRVERLLRLCTRPIALPADPLPVDDDREAPSTALLTVVDPCELPNLPVAHPRDPPSAYSHSMRTP